MKARWYVVVTALLGVVLLAACGAEGVPGDDGVAEPSPTEPSPTESEVEPTPSDTSGPDEPTPTDPTEEPTDMDEDRGPQRELTGTLGGDQQLEGGCAWLETAGGARYEVFWPQGYHVQWNPLRLVGPDGEAVAEAGEEITVVGAPARDMASICMVGELFEATEVR